MNFFCQWRLNMIQVATVAQLEAKIIRWHKLASRQLALAINCNCMQFIVSVQQEMF